MRKMMTIALSLALVACMLGTAYAVPSKTTSDLTKAQSVQVANGATTQPAVTVQVVTDTATTVEVLDELIKAITVNNKPVVDCFGDTAKEELVALLPTNVDTAAVTINEVFTMKVASYDASYGAVSVTMSTATQYSEGQPVVAMVCYVVNGVKVWKAIPAAVLDGQVVITFSEEVLQALNDEDFTVALLNA